MYFFSGCDSQRQTSSLVRNGQRVAVIRIGDREERRGEGRVRMQLTTCRGMGLTCQGEEGGRLCARDLRLVTLQSRTSRTEHLKFNLVFHP